MILSAPKNIIPRAGGGALAPSVCGERRTNSRNHAIEAGRGARIDGSRIGRARIERAPAHNVHSFLSRFAQARPIFNPALADAPFATASRCSLRLHPSATAQTIDAVTRFLVGKGP